jgi:hypothetical protein
MFKKLLPIMMTVLAGCGMDTFTQRETNPFIRDWFNNVNEPTALYITDASRRIVFEFKRGEHPHGFAGIEGAWPGNVVCIDPSPDASIAASGEVSSKLNVSLPGSTEFGDEASRRSSSSTMPLLRRSQGLQWGRDNVTNTCLMFGMGLLTHKEYMDEVKVIREESLRLIDKEIDNMGPLQMCCTESKSSLSSSK